MSAASAAVVLLYVVLQLSPGSTEGMYATVQSGRNYCSYPLPIHVLRVCVDYDWYCMLSPTV